MLERGTVHLHRHDPRQPMVILSPMSRNQFAHDVIVIPCSARIRRAPWHVLLRRGEGGLSRNTIARCELVDTVHKDLIEPNPLGAALPAARMREIELAVMRAIGASF